MLTGVPATATTSTDTDTDTDTSTFTSTSTGICGGWNLKDGYQCKVPARILLNSVRNECVG